MNIDSTSLAGATIDVPYSPDDRRQRRHVALYVVALPPARLPTGSAFDTAYGTISGTPTNVGTSNFTRAPDGFDHADAGNGEQALSISVTALPLVITTPYLRSGNTGAFYSQHFTATGGVNPFTWSVDSGTLPTRPHAQRLDRPDLRHADARPARSVHCPRRRLADRAVHQRQVVHDNHQRRHRGLQPLLRFGHRRQRLQSRLVRPAVGDDPVRGRQLPGGRHGHRRARARISASASRTAAPRRSPRRSCPKPSARR